MKEYLKTWNGSKANCCLVTRKTWPGFNDPGKQANVAQDKRSAFRLHAYTFLDRPICERYVGDGAGVVAVQMARLFTGVAATQFAASGNPIAEIKS